MDREAGVTNRDTYGTPRLSAARRQGRPEPSGQYTGAMPAPLTISATPARDDVVSAQEREEYLDLVLGTDDAAAAAFVAALRKRARRRQLHLPRPAGADGGAARRPVERRRVRLLRRDGRDRSPAARGARPRPRFRRRRRGGCGRRPRAALGHARRAAHARPVHGRRVPAPRRVGGARDHPGHDRPSWPASCATTPSTSSASRPRATRACSPCATRSRGVRRHSRNAQVCVIVGGRIFVDHPDLVARVGADGSAASAADASRCARALVQARTA